MAVLDGLRVACRRLGVLLASQSPWPSTPMPPACQARPGTALAWPLGNHKAPYRVEGMEEVAFRRSTLQAS
jgi:hypothetical protein